MASTVATRAAKPRTTFPPVFTASSWASVASAIWRRAQSIRGLDGSVLPSLTNADAVALVLAWKSAATAAKFPLWYQFAAEAYGWDPPDNDVFDVSRGASPYPSETNAQLWAAIADIVASLDAEAAPDPRVAFDGAAFDDVDVVSSVRSALIADGANAAFKIPLPACKDPITGKPTGKPHKNPKTGKWECRPVTIDDPITAGGKKLLPLALILGALWLATRKPRRSRRK